MSKEGLTKLIDQYLSAYSEKDAAGCAKAFTSDGALYSPYGPPAKGSQAIAETHMEWFADPEEDKKLEMLEFQQFGESGYCLLGWSAKVPNQDTDDGYEIASGKSLCILSIQKDEVLFRRLALIPDTI
ncbi:MAG: hypothetical protein AAGF54_14480 [Pseudomonadota bacterium]